MMTLVRSHLPSGTVTFLFTDVEGSTKLLHALGAAEYAKALAEHRRILRDAFGAHGGVEVDTQGDAFFVAFATAPDALRAAAAAQKGLAPGPIRVRMGLHTGTPHLTEEGYVGVDVHRAARIAASGHGGQVLVSASTAALLTHDGLRDLGEHRLKDLSAPERIFQFGEDQFPPLASLHQTNLPIASTPFMGRRKELTEVVGLLSREDVRLLTLSGPGGTGKTRLALEAAAELSSRYSHGVWWVPLASLRDPDLVLASAGQALGARNGVAGHIADRSMLLLFDNFEQVVNAASQVAGLLAACPHLEVLVTSREALHVSGEQEYPVPPLVPAEGVDLFVARARAVNPDFAADDAVSEICRGLDQLPLAIELAAARVKALSPVQILARLGKRLPLLTGGARDLPERQRTLRAAIEWSHELLTRDEQSLFGRLAVFRGGCTLETAEKVADADLDVLQSLVEKSLLRHRDERFGMLETIREYAAERLEASGRADELGRRHAEYFVALAEEAEPHLRRDSAEWADRLEREHDNLRAALDWGESAGESELVLRLAGAASRFWYLKSHVSEGLRRLESALRGAPQPTAARAKALSGAAVVALEIDTRTARQHAEEALALHRALGDTWGAAYATLMIGNAIGEGGEVAKARPFLDESVRLFRELGDELYVMIASVNLAWVTGELGDHEAERRIHNENLRRARSLGNRRIEATSLSQLALFARDEGRLRDAAAMLREAIGIEHDLGAVLELAISLGRLASVLALAGTADKAARLVSSSEALAENLGAGVPWWARKRNEETLATIRTQLDEPAAAEALARGRALTVDEAVSLALDADPATARRGGR
jgi:predicted ATPase/class 3 adenylate cyclase/predicted negative regulator of RcsB-dependent stress response